jgi:hypothetical protein
VLQPVPPAEQLPDDVEKLARELAETNQLPRVALAGPRGRRRALSRSLTGDDSALTVEEDLDAVLSRDFPAPALVTEPTPVPKLDQWAVRAHTYSHEAGGSLNIFAGLFGIGAKAKRAKAGAVHEAKAFTTARTDTGRECEWGVAVRLMVACTEWEAKIDLSIPSLAAAAEIGAQLEIKTGDARIGIEVAGYAGPLGSLLPAPRALDVTTAADYLVAFQKIQAKVFDEASLAFLSPVVLSADLPANADDDSGRE